MALHHHLASRHGMNGKQLTETVKKSAKVKSGVIKHKSLGWRRVGKSKVTTNENNMETDEQGTGPLQNLIPNQGDIDDELLSDFSCFLESQDSNGCSPHQCANRIKQLLKEMKFENVKDFENDNDIKFYFDKVLEECYQKLRRPSQVLSNLEAFKLFAEFLALRFPDTASCLKSWMDCSHPIYVEAAEKEMKTSTKDKRVSFGDKEVSEEKKIGKRGRKRKNSAELPISQHYLDYLQSREIKDLEDEMKKFADSTDTTTFGTDPMSLFVTFRDHMIVRMSVENAINPRVLKNFVMSSLLTSTEADGLFYYTIPEGKASIRLVVGGELVPLFAAYLRVREMLGRQHPACPFVFPTIDGMQMAVADTRDILSKAFKNDSLRHSITSETMKELASEVSLNISKEGTAMVTRGKARGGEVSENSHSGRPRRYLNFHLEGDLEDGEESYNSGKLTLSRENSPVLNSSTNLFDLDKKEKKSPLVNRSFDGKKKRMAWNDEHVEKLKELFRDAIENREVPTLTTLKTILMSDENFFNELTLERGIDKTSKADLTKLFYAVLCRVKTFL